MSINIETLVSDDGFSYSMNNLIRIDSRYNHGRCMEVDKTVFADQSEDIKKFNEDRLIQDIRRDVNEDLIDKYSNRFEAILNNTELYVNGSPLDTQVRLKLEACLMNFLFDIGFSARLVNNIFTNMKL